jgi:hypothetical protein
MNRRPPYRSVDWRGLPIKRPYPWERDMTVCIAAACNDSDVDKIILCSDTKLSSALGSVETGHKDLFLPNGWRILTAGDEPEIIPLYRLYRRRFRDANNITAEKIDESMKTPLRQRKLGLSDEFTFSRYNMSYADFIAMGKVRLPDEEFRNAIRSIAALHLHANVILAGFVDKSPEIYYTDNDGVARAANDFAIGEGEYLAHASLLRREQNSRSSLHETLYNIYEAKRYSESIGSVGKRTQISILSPGKKRELTSFNVDRQLEECYKEYGPRPLPYKFKLEGVLFYGEEKAASEAAAKSGTAGT